MVARMACLLTLAGLILVVSVGLVTASRQRLALIAKEPLLPTRFDHKFHTSVACITCHHNFVQRSLGPKRCLPCRKDWGTTEERRIDTVFHDFCTGCHRARAAAGEKAGPTKGCASCHVGRGAWRVDGRGPPVSPDQHRRLWALDLRSIGS
jgi:Class III cytochrome C family